MTTPLNPPDNDTADPDVQLAVDRIILWTNGPVPRAWPPDPPLPPLTPAQKRELVTILEQNYLPLATFLDAHAARSAVAPDRGPEPAAPATPLSASQLSEADLVDEFLRGHQPTVFANGRFWRRPFPKRPWQPLDDDQIAFEVLGTLQCHQSRAVAPTRGRLQSILELLRLRLAAQVTPGEWDDSRGYLPFPRFALPLAGSPDDAVEYSDDALPFVATTLPYDYDAAAECPHWLAFLHDTVPHALDFVQEFAGYCLTTHTHHELSLWVCGAPAGGKSTFLHGFQTLLGDFAGRLSLPDLARRRVDPSALAGKRLLLVDEAPPDFASIPALASIVDGTPFHLAHPHGLPFQVHTHAKLLLGFNGLPAVEPRYGSLYRRAAVLLFPPRPAGSDDPRLKDRIGHEGPGLFLWAWRGWQRLVQRGRFQPPETMLAAANHLRLALTGPAAFVAQHCLVDPNARASATELARAYRAWCQAQDLPVLSAKALATHWADFGFERLHTRDGNIWRGVSLLALPAPAPSDPAASTA